jgi:hypothetical protein
MIMTVMLAAAAASGLGVTIRLLSMPPPAPGSCPAGTIRWCNTSRVAAAAAPARPRAHRAGPGPARAAWRQ